MIAPVTIDKEMGITHAEFFRVMGRALENRNHRFSKSGVSIRGVGKSLEITLSEERERRIALMTIPATDVRLEFDGYSQEEIDATVTWFDRWFQRGGG
ncbi:MAG: hypothetical protein MI741_13425 [Rhodospirillales bacterium]|nr:hypothetical protein [Rhodospirillales bacterium]